MWGNPTLFHRVKSIEKNNSKKKNIELINREELFDSSKLIGLITVLIDPLFLIFVSQIT